MIQIIHSVAVGKVAEPATLLGLWSFSIRRGRHYKFVEFLHSHASTFHEHTSSFWHGWSREKRIRHATLNWLSSAGQISLLRGPIEHLQSWSVLTQLLTRSFSSVVVPCLCEIAKQWKSPTIWQVTTNRPPLKRGNTQMSQGITADCKNGETAPNVLKVSVQHR